MACSLFHSFAQVVCVTGVLFLYTEHHRCVKPRRGKKEIALQDPLICPPVIKFGSFAGEIKRCLYAYLTSHHPRMETLT